MPPTPPSDDQMQRHKQVPTGGCVSHCWLRSHLCRLVLWHTVDCPCETIKPTNPEHVVQSQSMLYSPGPGLYKEVWTQCWPPRSHACRRGLEVYRGPGTDNRLPASSIPETERGLERSCRINTQVCTSGGVRVPCIHI